MNAGSLVQLSETAKIQSGIETHEDVFGVILRSIDICSELGIKDHRLRCHEESNHHKAADRGGFEVLTCFGVDSFWDLDLKECV